MTYVEFFDREVLENICACFVSVPDKIIFLGSDKNYMLEHIERYKSVFADRDVFIEFEACAINKNKISEMIKSLSEIVEKEPECVFDLTGGDDLFLVAMGIVFEKYRSTKNIQMSRFNMTNNNIIDCDGDGKVLAQTAHPDLTVRELIRVFGGDIIDDTKRAEASTIEWNMTDEFIADIDKMWEICTTNAGEIYNDNKGNIDVHKWNSQIQILMIAEKISKSTDPLNTVVDLTKLKEALAAEGINYTINRGITRALSMERLARIEQNESTFSIHYKNEQVKRCLTKAGQVLEMKIYALAVKAVDNKKKKPVFNDKKTGVYIDWDGVLHENDNIRNTENEVDIILMRGMIPTFISCKNGYMDVSELYKLNSIANKFGGKYSKRILVVTTLDDGKFSEYLRQRAHDMGIQVIEPMRIPKETREAKLADLIRNA